MSARDILAGVGDFVKRHTGHLWTALCLALVGWSAYNLGLIMARHGVAPLQEAAVFQARQGAVPSVQNSSAPKPVHTDLRVVVTTASKSMKYHYSWCPGAAKIKPANQQWFATAGEAEAKGYSLAGNCTK